MNRKNTRFLLILGNGFDLQCHLRTTYQSFFDSRFKINLVSQIHFYYIKYVLKQSIDYQKILYEQRSKAKTFFRNMLYQNHKMVRLVIKEYINKSSDELEALKKVSNNNADLKERLVEIDTEMNEAISKDILNHWELVALAAFAFIRIDSPIMWSDVETMIFKIITWVLINKRKSDQELKKDDDIVDHKYYSALDVDLDHHANKSFVKFFNDYFFERAAINKTPCECVFQKIIEDLFYDNQFSSDIIANQMLDELIDFESSFSNFIVQQTGLNYKTDTKTINYCKYATELIYNLIYPNQVPTGKNTIIDILNFNYTFDIRFKIPLLNIINSKGINWKVNSWNNIHGVACWNSKEAIKQFSELFNNDDYVKLPAPIFGVDSHEILKSDKNYDLENDPRSIFTKSFRLLDNHVNDIRKTSFQEKIDEIIFYGHSLNKADYSYFESIFDTYDVFHSNVKIKFYYWRGYDKSENINEQEKQLRLKKQERKTMSNIFKLLNSYGSTLANEHGENIINKLMLEQRLEISPSPLI